MRGSRQKRRRRLLLYLTKRRRRRRMAIAVTVMVFVGLIAYAGNILSKSAHKTTELTKERYIEIELSGSSVKGSIRPGGSILLAPVVENKGTINCTAFVKLTIPKVYVKVSGDSISTYVPAYDYETNSNWKLIEEDSDSGYQIVVVYAYMNEYNTYELELLSPGLSTSSLVKDGFTMINMSSAEFMSMTDVDIQVDGYLVDEEGGSDPESVWAAIQ